MKVFHSLATAFSIFIAFDVSATVRYVNTNSPGPVAPYTNWVTAATDIQTAVNACVAGDTVLVTNGVYKVGGISSRVGITLAITVQSVNGPQATVIEGFQVPGTTNGASAVRCVTLGSSAKLFGFTLTNGATRPGFDGGGVNCSSTSCLVSNCVIIGNASIQSGGGASSGTLKNCTVARNYAENGGGAVGSTLVNCAVFRNYATTAGGGAYQSTLVNCVITNNAATEIITGNGGGAASSSLTNCTLVGNVAAYGGGISFGSTAINCLLYFNTAESTFIGATGRPIRTGGGADTCVLTNCVLFANACTLGGVTAGRGGGAFGSALNGCLIAYNIAGFGGGTADGCTLKSCTVADNSGSIGSGAYQGTANNCILYYNSSPATNDYSATVLNDCCVPVLPASGSGNITNLPAFVTLGADYRLSSISPCINAGNNAQVALNVDLNANPRIVGGTVDLGAYEFQSPVSTISYAWLQQYGLAINSSVDQADPDIDHMSNWQEWRAGTVPVNASSLLQMFPPSTNALGILVSWQSVTNRTYFLQRSVNLSSQPSFSALKSNLTGQAGTTVYTDTNAPGPGPYFYRVGVQ